MKNTTVFGFTLLFNAFVSLGLAETNNGTNIYFNAL